jgi:hypothetical protein
MHPSATPRRPIRRLLAVAQIGLLLALPAYAGSPPPPPDYVPTPPYPAYEVYALEPHDPPPLPIALRVIYAPFYATGLVIRYGFYYLVVAPLEVLGRTLAYGVEGGVEPQSREGR